MTTPPTYNQAFETAKQNTKTAEGEWQYWTQLYGPAVEFAKAAITPEMSPTEKQAILRASLDTLEAWTRSEPQGS